MDASCAEIIPYLDIFTQFAEPAVRQICMDADLPLSREAIRMGIDLASILLPIAGTIAVSSYQRNRSPERPRFYRVFRNHNRVH